ncbi:MAG: carbohydrate ABC transporter permease [Actinobacteria bacterium]|nr:carbohydrate ABC transporter permease [Actinomycetota bacterium]
MLKKKVLKIIKYTFLALAASIGIFPFLLVFLTSIKTRVDAIAMPPKWFFVPTLENYIEQLFDKEFINSAKNSLIIAGSATLISTFLGIFAGYTLVRFKFIGSRLLSQSILWIRMVPPITFVIPYFVIWSKLRLADTYFALIAMYITIALPLITWMMYSFFQEIPIEIEEAALVDGCNRWQTLRYVLIPAVFPGIFAASSLSFILLWNEFLFALFITGRVTRTLPVEIYASIGYYEMNWAKLSTIAVVAIIPAIVFISLTQKYIVRGLTMGAVKE